MKKSIFRVLTLSLVVGGVSLFSSCKDYDEDLRTEYNSELANLDLKLNDLVNKQVATLNGELAELQDALEAIKQCNCGVDRPWTADLSSAIAAAMAEVDSKLAGKLDANSALQSIVTEILTQSLGGYYDKNDVYTKAEVEKAIQDAVAALSKCNCDMDALKEELQSSLSTSITTIVTQNIINSVAADSPGTPGVMTDLKEAFEKKFATKESVESLKGDVDNLTKKVEMIVSCACTCKDLTEAIAKINKRLDGIDKHLQQHCDSIAQLYEDFKLMNQTLVEVKNKADQAYELADTASARAKEVYDYAKTVMVVAEKASEDATKALADAKNAMDRANEAYNHGTDAYNKAEEALTEAKKAYNKAEEALADAKTAYNHADAAHKEITNLKSSIDQLKAKDEELAGLIETAQTKADEAYDLAYEANTTATNAFTSFTILNNTVSEIRTDLDKLIEQVEANTNNIANNKDSIAINAGNIAANKDSIDALKIYVDGLAEKIQANTDSIESLKNQCKLCCDAAKAYADAQIVEAKTALEEKITFIQAALENKINNVNNRVDKVNDRIDSLDNVLKAADAATNVRIDALNATLIQHLGESAEKFSKIETDISALHQLVDSNYNDLHNLIESNYNDLDARVKALEDWKVGDFATWQQQVNDNIDGLQEAVSDLQTRVSGLETLVTGMMIELANLTDRVSNIETTLKNMVTGVTVNAITNPVFGMLNMPANIKTNVLVAYYGKNDGDNVVFPDVDPLNYVRSSEAFTAKEWEMIEGSVETVNIKAGKKLIEDTNNNAGTVYLTINPNTTDFTGATLELVNSQDKSAGMVLAPLAKSDKVLKLGYTRAASNGFYEMKVKVADEANVQKVNFEAGRFKDVLSDAKNYKDGFNVANAVKTVYDLFNDMLDANAVKATWEDAEGVKHSVYSDYNIAATAVHPLSYNFLADKSFDHVPGFDRVNSFIDRAANKLTNQLKKSLDKAFNKVTEKFPTTPEVKKFDLDHNSVDYNNALACFNVTTSATIKYDEGVFTIDNDLNIKDNAGNIVGKMPEGTVVNVRNGEMVISIKMDLREDFSEFYNNVAGNVNDLVESIEKFCQDATTAVSAMNDISSSVSDISDDLVGSLHRLLDKVENKLVSLMNTAVSYLQPVMLYTAGSSMRVMNGAVNYPSKISTTSIKLHPYSYTAETINPAYKKHVAVVNVINNATRKSAQDGDATCKALLNAVNSQANMNKAINGSVREIAISGLKSGYTYQFAYTAMDYSGYIVTKRSAISVK